MQGARCARPRARGNHEPVFNLTNAQASDVDYFYPSRLPGEPAAGVADLHTHPLEPRTFRASMSAAF